MSAVAPDVTAPASTAFREAMSRLASGVVLVTSSLDGRPWGMTVSAACPVCVEPPTMLVSLSAHTALAAAISGCGRFGVSVLGEEAVEVARFGSAPGAPKFLDEEMEERTKDPGVAIGLAWTPVGGEVLFIEASRMAGTGSLTLTGQLGDVMKESARAALSWLRTHAKEYGIDPDFFKSAEMHVHVPSGAIPKDGPSAGVTMAAAMASQLTGRPVRGDVAMTGEITLSGRVLPVGGIKEKVLAARRAGIREIILPKQNAKNINEDLTPELRQDLIVHLVSTIDEVLALALQPNAQQTTTPMPPQTAEALPAV